MASRLKLVEREPRTEKLDTDGNPVGIDLHDRTLAVLDEMASASLGLTQSLVHAKERVPRRDMIESHQVVANLIEATTCAIEVRGNISGEIATLYAALCHWTDVSTNDFGEEEGHE